MRRDIDEVLELQLLRAQSLTERAELLRSELQAVYDKDQHSKDDGQRAVHLMGSIREFRGEVRGIVQTVKACMEATKDGY